MEKEAKAWVIGPIVTMAALGVAGLLYDLNTTDDEVIPRVDILEKVAAQNSISLKQNSDSLNSLATSRAMSSMTVGIKQLSALEAKYGSTPRDQWLLADQTLYNVSEDRIKTAQSELSEGN
jgi:hypothetical protein